MPQNDDRHSIPCCCPATLVTATPTAPARHRSTLFPPAAAAVPSSPPATSVRFSPKARPIAMVLNLLLVPLQSHAFPTGGLCLDSERVVHATGQVALGVSFDQTGFERARDGTISFAGAAPVAYSFACMDEADAAFLLEECAPPAPARNPPSPSCDACNLRARRTSLAPHEPSQLPPPRAGRRALSGISSRSRRRDACAIKAATTAIASTT